MILRDEKGRFIKGTYPKSGFKKGQIPWNKDKHFSEESKRKMSKAHRGKIPWNKNIKGIMKSNKTSFKKGVHSSIKTEFKKGHHSSLEIRKKMSESMKGKNHWNWKGGLSSLIENVRNCFKYRQWVSDVFTRDDFTCQECGIRGGRLQVHHIKSFSSIFRYYEITTMEEALECAELWNINNGITLCKDCHKKTDSYLVYKKIKIDRG